MIFGDKIKDAVIYGRLKVFLKFNHSKSKTALF